MNKSTLKKALFFGLPALSQQPCSRKPVEPLPCPKPMPTAHLLPWHSQRRPRSELFPRTTLGISAGLPFLVNG
jgi:hypothetical protein